MSTLNIIKPYYKYKQEAYNNLNQLAKSLLDEFGFYKQFPQFKDSDVVVFKDASNSSGSISFRVSNSSLWLFTLETNFHVRKNSFLSGRSKLTLEESQIISKNVITLFKTGSNSTVVKKLNDAITYWHASKNECYFKSVSGSTYINRG